MRFLLINLCIIDHLSFVQSYGANYYSCMYLSELHLKPTTLNLCIIANLFIKYYKIFISTDILNPFIKYLICLTLVVILKNFFFLILNLISLYDILGKPFYKIPIRPA